MNPLPLLFLSWLASPQADGVRVPSPGVIPEGEALIGELGCLNCHAADPALATRFAPRRAPDLEEVSRRHTADSLRGLLMDPQGQRPGTAMPDLLHGLDASQRQESVEDLVHYLISRGTPEDPQPFMARESMLANGRRLLHEVGCVACHGPEVNRKELNQPYSLELERERPLEPQTPGPNAKQRYVEPGTLTPPQVPYGDLARRTSVPSLTEFLLDPLRARPSGRMPSLGLSRAEARDISTYLLRQQLLQQAQEDTPGMRFDYYESSFNSGTPDLEALQPVRGGLWLEEIGALVDAKPPVDSQKHRNDHFAFRLSGVLVVTQPGTYRFRSASDDGSWVHVDGHEVVANSGMHALLSKSGSVELEAGRHSVRLSYFEGAGDQAFEVFWSGPGFEERALRGDDLVHPSLPMHAPSAGGFTLDPRRAERGAERFRSLGCAACHEPASSISWPLSQCQPTNPAGCTGEQPSARSASYGWSQAQRKAVQATLQRLPSLSAPSPSELVKGLFASQRCYACHRRDGLGGPHPDRGDYFQSKPGVDLGEDGRIPPLLSSVGSKLTRPWLHAVLQAGATARPALLTRMPQFAPRRMQQLEEALVEADAVPNAPQPEAFSAELRLAGRELAGTKGFGCIQCHTFDGHASIGIQAVDLTRMKQRIQYPWYRQLMEDPDRIGMNSRMPYFWIQGHKSPFPDVLGGDITRQIDALWAYMMMGASMPLPEGLNIPDSAYEIELAPGDAPKLVAVFMRGLSPRVLAVGTPELVHYAFDVENSRLAKVWRGRFFNMRGTWEGRAGQLELPPTTEVFELPPGPPFALLESADSPWPATEGRQSSLRPRGRSYDDARNPIFKYSLGEIDIEEAPVAVQEGAAGVLLRRLHLSSQRPIQGLYFQGNQGRIPVRAQLTPEGDYRATIEERITW